MSILGCQPKHAPIDITKQHYHASTCKLNGLESMQNIFNRGRYHDHQPRTIFLFMKHDHNHGHKMDIQP